MAMIYETTEKVGSVGLARPTCTKVGNSVSVKVNRLPRRHIHTHNFFNINTIDVKLSTCLRIILK